MATASYKLVLLGETAVGKSSLVLRFVRSEFCDHQDSTIGAAFLTQSVNLGDYIVKYEIWDTAGQERYRSLAPMYYRGAAAAVVVYDITSHHSFERAKQWIKELQRQGDAAVVIALAGNKVDLSEKREVATADARAYADENGLIFFETSAKATTHVTELFTQIAKALPRREALPPPPRPTTEEVLRERKPSKPCAC